MLDLVFLEKEIYRRLYDARLHGNTVLEKILTLALERVQELSREQIR